MDAEATRPAPLGQEAPLGAGDPARAIPGWHGKLPTLGDFASRRLDPAFIEVWDGWLAAGLLRLRETDPEGWLAAYLASPSWRFWLLPGALPGPAGDCGWAGVLMPSVDRVGRYFPLTLALPLHEAPRSPPALAALWGWLARLDELAADALHEDWSADALEARLAAMAAPAAELALAPPAVVTNDAATRIAALALQDWTQAARGQAWWQACPEGEVPRLWRSTGLPADLAALFGPAPVSPHGLAAPDAPGVDAGPGWPGGVPADPATARGRM